MVRKLLIIFLLLFLSSFNAVFASINLNFFERFNDELLTGYIIKSVNNNYNLKNLRLKINALCQVKNMEVSKEFPTLSVGANYLGLKIPKMAFPFQGFRDNAFALPFMTTWEIDLFGKRKNKIEMKREDVNAAIYEEKGAIISLAGEIAAIYFNISNLNEQIDIQEKIIQNREERLKRAQKSFQNGVIGHVELNSIKKALKREENILNDYKKQRETFLSNMSYLTGEAPSSLHEVKNIKEIEYSGAVPDKIRGDEILSRPDICEKEANLKKAKIDVLLARKAFLPDVNVFGVLMFSTLTPNFLWKGAVANLLAGATEQIFTGGKRIFNLKYKKIEYERMLNEYLDTDLKALKEVNDALYNLKKDDETYKNNLETFAFEEDNFIRVSNSYKSGVKGYLDFLDKDNELYLEKSKMLNSKVQKFVDLISLYKALGGEI